MTIKQAAKKWGVTPSLVSILLRLGRVPGAFKRPQTSWDIPEGSLKPIPLKKGRPRKTNTPALTGQGNAIRTEAL
jgi:hypothetical protein